MTARPPQARRASQRPTAALAVAALLAVLTILVGAASRVDTHASTTTRGVAETHVRAHDPLQPTVIEARQPIVPGQGRETPVVAAKTAIGSRVAPNTARGAGNALEPLWAQAPNKGFLGGWSKTETLRPGTIIDRYGPETGRFFSPAGTPLEARALPAGAGQLHAYEVLKPFNVQGGIAGPAFGQPGLGIQYMAPHTVADLIEGGFIKVVTP